MDEKKELLRQIGWSEELIEKCLSPDDMPALTLPQLENHPPIPSEQDVTDIFLKVDTPTITDGTN